MRAQIEDGPEFVRSLTPPKDAREVCARAEQEAARRITIIRPAACISGRNVHSEQLDDNRHVDRHEIKGGKRECEIKSPHPLLIDGYAPDVSWSSARGSGSTHLLCSRIKSTRRSTASVSGILNLIGVLPT